MNIDLEELARRLGGQPPAGYVTALRQMPAVLERRGFDPKTLCILNLELREVLDPDALASRFFLSGDGCGNYYFVNVADPGKSARVLLWAHDPPGIEDPQLGIDEFFVTFEQENRIEQSPPEGEFRISRTRVSGESVLVPISLNEWKATVSSETSIDYRGYRVWTNPFTGEASRLPAPGLAILRDAGQCSELRLLYGRVWGAFAPALHAHLESLASRLAADLVLAAGTPG